MTLPDLAPSQCDVAVIGCGLMGAALARTLAARGRSVAVWNRSPERALSLAGNGIKPVLSVREAVSSAPLVIACTLNYESTLAALSPVRDWERRAFVNLATGTPDEALSMAQWASDRNAQYLDGAVLSYPRDIGTDENILVYSGAEDVWSDHGDILRLLGGASYFASEQVHRANLLLTGMAGFYITALSAYIESVSYLKHQGLSSDDVRTVSGWFSDHLGTRTEEAAEKVGGAKLESDQAALTTYADGLRTTVSAMDRAGHPAPLARAALKALESAERDGLGNLGIFALGRLAPPGG
jgi:3-hydroxyisobutyrate dehydrogenase-like beta-hydroxyacid dehydrogenase